MKSLISLLTLTCFNLCCFGQTTGDVETGADTTIEKSNLTVGAVYANNASYYGQKAAESMPYAALAASYRFRSGFYLSALTYKLINEKTSGVSAASVGAGFSFKLAEKLTADLGYSHSFYPENSPLLQAGNADNASVGLIYASWVNVNLTGDYMFGETKDAFVTGGLSKSVNLFSIGAKDVVTINPSADVVAGTQHFYETYLTQKKFQDSLLGGILNPVTGAPGSSSNTTTVAKTSFNVLSYNFKLPLAYNRAHYVLEAAYQLSLLSKEAQTGAGQANSFLTLSFYYQF